MVYVYDIRGPEGVSTDQYDRTNRKLKFPEDAPQGLLFHVAAMTDTVGRVVELWESTEDQEAFVRDRLADALQESGIGEPEFEAIEAHDAVLGEGPIESGVLFDVTAPGVTLEQYDAVSSAAIPEGDLPEGLCFHVAFAGDGGLRIIEVWDSLEANERHVEQDLTPVLEQQGIDPETIEVEPTKIHKAYLF